MLTIYLNTTENLFLDASGNGFPEGYPKLSVGGKEEVHLFLKKSTSDWGTEGANPNSWTPDTSWGEIPGISAMLTVDDDYKKYIKGALAENINAGELTLPVTMGDAEDIPLQGVLRLTAADGAVESVSFSSRSISGQQVTFTLGSPVARDYPKGSVADCTAAPLAQAYLAADKSNWSSGELVFDLILDSARLRAENDYKDQEKVPVNGIELLLYSLDKNIVQVRRAFLLDTATLHNVQGNPGFNAPLPEPMLDNIAAEVGRQIEDVVDRVTPGIGDNGNWIIDGVDSGKSSVGKPGNPGQPGTAAGFGTPVLNVTTGEPGTQASGTVNTSGPDTAKVFAINLTIPQGRQGEQGAKGDPMKIDATGVSGDLSQYDAEPKGFSYLATDTGKVYIKNSDTSGDWSDPVGFQGPAGYTPVKGTDYWTEEDIAEIKSYVDEAIINGAW